MQITARRTATRIANGFSYVPRYFGFYFLIVIAVLLLGYAAVLVSFVRRGKKIPPAGYLGLAALNGLILAAVLAWAVVR